MKQDYKMKINLLLRVQRNPTSQQKSCCIDFSVFHLILSCYLDIQHLNPPWKSAPPPPHPTVEAEVEDVSTLTFTFSKQD